MLTLADRRFHVKEALLRAEQIQAMWPGMPRAVTLDGIRLFSRPA